MRKIIQFLFWFPINVNLAHRWYVSDQHIYYNDQKFGIRGANWFGFETKSMCVEGLWENSLDYYFDKLNLFQINSLRIPVSEELIMYNHKIIDWNYVKNEPLAYNKTGLQILDLFMHKAYENHIAILIDIHRLKAGVSSPLWYIENNDNYSATTLVQTMENIIDRYHEYPNFLGIDIYNEPHYSASWTSENISISWKHFIEMSSDYLFSKYPEHQFLLFVNGLDWGKNLSEWGKFPLNTQHLERIVFSPHLYGPSITYIPEISKNYLYPLWDTLFGYLKLEYNYYLCIGEYGARFDNPKSHQWIHIFSDYLIERDIKDNFFWALNPFSKDVDGIMQNWSVWNLSKIDFIQNIQPYPSLLQY